MPFISGLSFTLKDRVKETTQTSGTGAYSLDGVSAGAGLQSFLTTVGDGNVTAYVVERGSTWERGLGTVSAGAPVTLSRDLILGTSADDSVGADPINWPSTDPKDILIDVPSNLLNQIIDPQRVTDLEARDTELTGQLATFEGSKMLFVHSAAPTGWTQDTSHNDRVLRIVNGAGTGTGGSWTISGLTADGTSLTTSQLPSISVSVPIRTDGAGASGDAAAFGAATTNDTLQASSSGAGQTHGHGVSSDGNWRPSYLDTILCTDTSWLAPA